MSTENIGGVSHAKHSPEQIKTGPVLNPEAVYKVKMDDLIGQRTGFLKGIAEYEGNITKVAELRKKMNNPKLFTEKADIEKEQMWSLNMSEYQKSLQGVEAQIRELRAKYGKPAEPGVQ